MMPNTYLKDLKLINQLENELIKKISFSFTKLPYVKGLSSPYLIINYGLTNKDLGGKF